jgi:hypothetical protein
MIRHSASTVNRSSHPPGRAPFLVFPGGDCFCLRYLLSDESWRIELTQKAMASDFCVVFCVTGEAKFFLTKPNLSSLRMHRIHFAEESARGIRRLESRFTLNQSSENAKQHTYIIYFENSLLYSKKYQIVKYFCHFNFYTKIFFLI